MKKIFLVLITLFVVSFANAQSVTEQKLNAFNTFVTNVNKNYKSYTTEDWAKQSKTYDAHCAYFTDAVKAKMTSEQKDRLTSIKSKYYAIKTKDSASGAAGATKTFVKTLFD